MNFSQIKKQILLKISIQKKVGKNGNAKKCSFCDEPFYEEEEGINDKVKDHCHETKKYRWEEKENHMHSKCETKMLINFTNSFT